MADVFEIEVFSSPIAACSADGYMERADFHKAAEYDEALVRPAILLADKVRLVSQRIDKMHGLRGAMLASNRLSVPRMASAVGISTRRDPKELDELGLTVADLLPLSEISTDLRECREGLEVRFAKQIHEINHALWKFYERMLADFGTNGLQVLEDSGVLTVDRWSTLDIVPPFAVVQVESDEYLDDSAQGVARRIVNANSGLMLDSTLHSLVANAQRPNEWRAEHELHGAADLMRMVTGFDAIPTDELLGVRAELAEYLAPFRAFLLSVSRGIEDAGSESESERRRELELAWIREVEPAIFEMRAMVSAGSFKRNLLSLDFDSIKGLAMGIALSGSAIYFGAASAAPLALAAPSVVNSVQTTLRARGESKRNPVYFIYSMERLRRLRRGGTAARP